jgi:serine/threonine protein kinase
MPLDPMVQRAFGFSDEADLVRFCEKKRKEAEKYFAPASLSFFKKDIDMVKKRRGEAGKASIVKIGNAYYLMATKGQYLGAGGYGKAKLALKLERPMHLSDLYVVKVNMSNVTSSSINIGATKKAAEIGYRIGFAPTQELVQRASKKDTKQYGVSRYKGETLDKLCDDTQPSLTEDERWEIAVDLCFAVARLHSQGYAHGDIKPSNISMERKPGQPIEISLIDYDFGTTVRSTPTGPRAALYSPASEQTRKDMGVVQLDIYAIKQTLYLCGPAGPSGGHGSVFTENMLTGPLNAICMPTTWIPKTKSDSNITETAMLLGINLLCYRLFGQQIGNSLPMEAQLAIQDIYREAKALGHPFSAWTKLQVFEVLETCSSLPSAYQTMKLLYEPLSKEYEEVQKLLENVEGLRTIDRELYTLVSDRLPQLLHERFPDVSTPQYSEVLKAMKQDIDCIFSFLHMYTYDALMIEGDIDEIKKVLTERPVKDWPALLGPRGELGRKLSIELNVNRPR